MPADLPLIVEPEQLEPILGLPGLLIVDLNDPPMFLQGHVPGAVNLPYASLIGPQPPAMGRIAGAEQLSRAFSSIGMTPDSHVVAYDGEGNGRAARLLWTLDAVGHKRASLLNGGWRAWAGEGHRVESGAVDPVPSDYKVAIGGEVIARKDYILGHLKDPKVLVLDVRSPAEYAGKDVRSARGGHIPGAVNMDWTLALDRARSLRLKPEAEIRATLEKLGVTPDKEVITHCQTHQRSAHTYIVLKSLGFTKIKGYDGSWSEWGNDPAVPVES
jgi:thiosulfate/3-mercaptopyruvate sulfurtransferase